MGRLGLLPDTGDIEGAVRRVFAPHLASEAGGRTWAKWRGTLRLLRPLGWVSQGNRIEVLKDGDEAYRSMWEAIDAARRSVILSTYVLEPDRVGKRTLATLESAASRGVAVWLVYDGFGSYRLERGDVRSLREAGARILVYNPPFRVFPKFSRLVRNHQKVLVVDGDVGFCGGMNVSEDYAGEELGTNLFRDAHLRIEGPAAADLAHMVEEVVQDRTGESLPALRELAPREDGSLVQILESNVRRQRRAIQKALRYTTARAVERCFLTSPYFVPPRRLMRDLRKAAQRGVDVRVLTAGKSDVPLVSMASQHLYGRLLRAGVRIFEMQDRVLHAKTVTIDGVWGSVGSFNLDRWSYRRNLEVNVSVLDTRMAERLEERFLGDLELSTEVRIETWGKRGWFQRVVHWTAYQLMRL